MGSSVAAVVVTDHPEDSTFSAFYNSLIAGSSFAAGNGPNAYTGSGSSQNRYSMDAGDGDTQTFTLTEAITLNSIFLGYNDQRSTGTFRLDIDVDNDGGAADYTYTVNVVNAWQSGGDNAGPVHFLQFDVSSDSIKLGAGRHSFTVTGVTDNGEGAFLIAPLVNSDNPYAGGGVTSNGHRTVSSGEDLIFAVTAVTAGLAPVVTIPEDRDRIVTWLENLPETGLAGTVDDQGEGDLASVTWEIISGPGFPDSTAAKVTDTTTDMTTPTASFDVIGTPSTATGLYTIRLTVEDNAAQSDSATLQIHVEADACEAAKQTPCFCLSEYDIDEDCDVDIVDFAAFVSQWLDDVTPTAIYVGPSESLAEEDGYKLWLRYAEPGEAAQKYRSIVKRIRVDGDSATCLIIRDELQSAAEAMLDRDVPVCNNLLIDGTVVIGTPDNSDVINDLNWSNDLDLLGDEGYLIRSTKISNQSVTVIAANSDIGTLYGSYHFLRLMQTAQSINSLNITETPALGLRLMNHWDNLNGSIERGYAGRSLWQWNELPGTLSQRYTDYARVCASIGINGSAINNVNADANILTTAYLHKVAALADVFRPYGVRMYLSANFAAPVKIDRLSTADPLDPDVIEWWTNKADEIYSLIPDFGGFLVKANSEGQPGPKTYGRTHAEGANLLARAVAPHGGIVMWRAFVYDVVTLDEADRSKRAYQEFMPLDGEFDSNVAVQVKNGAIDFMPLEPFHPLFGGMEDTPLIAEIQPSQEYLGHAKHLVYHGPMWEDFLNADTYAKGNGSTVANVLAGKVHPQQITGLVGVVNPGLDTNWCGHHFSQANWYVFGRFAWNPGLSSESIANEWIRMTFTNDTSTVAVISDMMMGSHDAIVSYSMPLGLHHLIGGDHYAPQPWNNSGGGGHWSATGYHQADQYGIGYDRTLNGSNGVSQYHPPVRDMLNNVETCPEKFLLWFHHLPWDYTMNSGKTLWEELEANYFQGAAYAARMQITWQSLEGKIDTRRYREVAERLQIQVTDSVIWRDQGVGYFRSKKDGH